jgi:hypothetical protein
MRKPTLVMIKIPGQETALLLFEKLFMVPDSIPVE